jgi:hypothetical protein
MSWLFLDFISSSIVWSLNLNWIQIQTQTMTNLLPKSFSKALTACWAGSFLRWPVGPSSLIGPADRAALRPNPPEFSFFICSLSLTGGAALSATLSYPFSLFPPHRQR